MRGPNKGALWGLGFFRGSFKRSFTSCFKGSFKDSYRGSLRATIKNECNRVLGSVSGGSVAPRVFVSKLPGLFTRISLRIPKPNAIPRAMILVFRGCWYMLSVVKFGE